MAKTQPLAEEEPTRKPLVWLQGEVKSPPFSAEARQEAGMLLRFLQEGQQLGMPHAEMLASIGPRCGSLRIRDEANNWRIVFRIDPDAILVLEVYSKKTRKIPSDVIDRCKKRLRMYDELS